MIYEKAEGGLPVSGTFLDDTLPWRSRLTDRNPVILLFVLVPWMQ